MSLFFFFEGWTNLIMLLKQQQENQRLQAQGIGPGRIN